MPRANDTNRPVMLTAAAARRVSRAVAAFERGDRDQSPIRFRTAGDDGDPIRVCKTVEPWLKNTAQELDVWEDGTPPSETATAGDTITAINKVFDVAADVFVHVALARNGTWYLIEAGTPAECKSNIAGHDLSTVSGYDAYKAQALTHDAAGCLKWVDIEECTPEEPPP